MSLAPPVTVKGEVLRDIIAHARRCRPQEACGLLAGHRTASDVAIAEFFAVPNVAPSPERTYLLDPTSMLAAEDAAEAKGLEIIGVMHSHPTTPAEPSATDVADAMNYDPTHRFVQMLVSLTGQEPDVAVWRLGPVRPERLVLEVK